MNKYLISFVVLFIIFIGAYYLFFTNPGELQTTSETPTTTAETIKIGLLIPMTGEMAPWGEAALAGVRVAAKEINDAGGVNGHSLEIFSEDDLCTAEGAVTAMTKLVVAQQVTAVIGSLCPVAAAASNPIAQAAMVPTLMVGMTAPNLTRAGDFIFQMTPTDVVQAKVAAAAIGGLLGKKKAAIITLKNDSSEAVEQSFTASYQGVKGQVVAMIRMTDASEAKAAVTKIKSVKAEAVYLAVPTPIAKAFLQEMKKQKITALAVGDLWWATDMALLNAPEAAGQRYLAPVAALFEPFQARVATMTGARGSLLGGFAYDAVQVLAEALKQSGTDKKSLRTALSNVYFDRGVTTSVIAFDDARQLKDFTAEIQTIAAMATSTPVASSTPSSTTR